MSERRIIEYVFVWHALGDACPVCQTLNGHVFHDQQLFQNTLWHPIYGDVWDLNADRTGAHPNCRCQLEVRTITHLYRWEALTEYESIVAEALQLIGSS